MIVPVYVWRIYLLLSFVALSRQDAGPQAGQTASSCDIASLVSQRGPPLPKKVSVKLCDRKASRVTLYGI